jgi:hypothetical protein
VSDPNPLKLSTWFTVLLLLLLQQRGVVTLRVEGVESILDQKETVILSCGRNKCVAYMTCWFATTDRAELVRRDLP